MEQFVILREGEFLTNNNTWNADPNQAKKFNKKNAELRAKNLTGPTRLINCKDIIVN